MPIAADLGEVAFLEKDEALGDRQQGEHVGGDKILAHPQPITKGLPARVTTMRSGSSGLITARA